MPTGNEPALKIVKTGFQPIPSEVVGQFLVRIKKPMCPDCKWPVEMNTDTCLADCPHCGKQCFDPILMNLKEKTAFLNRLVKGVIEEEWI